MNKVKRINGLAPGHGVVRASALPGSVVTMAVDTRRSVSRY
jgi:hypothetical protein